VRILPSLSHNGSKPSVGSPLRVVIADDHALLRQALKTHLKLHPGITVVAEAARADELLPLIARTPCDILLLDLQMERSSLTDIAALAAQTQVIVVTASEQRGEMLAALRAGARGVVFKRFGVEHLMDAIRAVTSGHVWVPPELQACLTEQHQKLANFDLTAREVEVIRHVARGLRNAEIAQQLFISEDTVKTHLNNIFPKVGVRDRVELTLYAIRVGIAGASDQTR